MNSYQRRSWSYHSFWGIAIGAVLSTGCASARLNGELNALSAESARQNAEIDKLQAELAARDSSKVANDLVVDGSNLASSAFAWSSAHVVAAYHRTSDAAAACYAATDFSALHTWDDYKVAALKCWNLDTTTENK